MSISDLTREDLEQLLAVTSKEEFLGLSKELHKHCLVNIDDLVKIMDKQCVSDLCVEIKKCVEVSIKRIVDISGPDSEMVFELPDFFTELESSESAMDTFSQNYQLYSDSIQVLCESYKSIEGSDEGIYNHFRTMQSNGESFIAKVNEVKDKINNPSNIEMTVDEKVSTSAPVAEEPAKVEEPAPEEKKVEEPAPEEKKVEEPAPEEKKVEEPAPEEKKVEEPAPEVKATAVELIENKEEVIAQMESQLRETLDGLTSAFKQFEGKKKSVEDCRNQLLNFEKQGMNVSAALEPLTAQLDDVSNTENALLHLFREKTSELYGIFKNNV